VAVVRGEDGALRQLHLDYRHDDSRGGSVGGGAAERPVVASGHGVVDGDHPRIVVDLDGATDAASRATTPRDDHAHGRRPEGAGGVGGG
jgi:hypothetical protein